MNWYCLHTKPIKEAQVDSYCRTNLGVETYFPRLRQYRTIRRERKLVTSPLFPRYIFARFDPAISYRAVRYAQDVINIVHAGNSPAIVEDALIDEMKQWAGEDGNVITLAPTLHPGDRVQLIAGPLQGLSAVILHASDERDRVTILLSILQCGAQMTVRRSLLEHLPIAL